LAASLFEFIAGKIQQQTDLDQLEARGTVRIALKEAGLDARNVTVGQMSVMLDKTMPRELEARGVADAPGLCRGLIAGLEGFQGDAGGPGESPEDVFRRLGGR
jgi:hypothetical protein